MSALAAEAEGAIAGAAGVEAHDAADPGAAGSSAPATRRGLWGAFCKVGASVYHGLEYAGECLAEVLGLNDSQYQWAIDEYMRRKQEEDDHARMLKEEEAERLEDMEAGEQRVTV